MKRYLYSIFLLVFSLSIAAGYVFTIEKELIEDENENSNQILASLYITK